MLSLNTQQKNCIIKWKLLFWDPRKRWTVNWDDVSLSRRRANAENREKSKLWKVYKANVLDQLWQHTWKVVWHYFYVCLS
jgi:hypothetical protein